MEDTAYFFVLVSFLALFYHKFTSTSIEIPFAATGCRDKNQHFHDILSDFIQQMQIMAIQELVYLCIRGQARGNQKEVHRWQNGEKISINGRMAAGRDVISKDALPMENRSEAICMDTPTGKSKTN